jgi:HD-like signal output (HDOD) protein
LKYSGTPVPHIESFFTTVQIPSISYVAEALIRTLHSEDATVPEVCDIIARDPAIAARLLKLTNSSQFGLSRSVGLLEDAVSLVGMERVRSLAVGVSLNDSFQQFPGLDRHAFWASTMDCAGYAQWLAPRAGLHAHID